MFPEGEGRLTMASDRLDTLVMTDMNVGRTGTARVVLTSDTQFDLLGQLTLGLEPGGSGTLSLTES